MEVSLLNVKIQIQQSEVVVDEIGNHKNVWKAYYSCFATASGECGFEKYAAGVIVDDSDISFTIRYCKDTESIDMTKHRVLFHDEIYNIVGIDHMHFKKKCIKLKCKKVRS